MKRKNEHSFTFNEVRIDPQHQIGMHQQHSWELSYIIVGSGTRTIGDTTEPFHCGELALVPPEIPHCWIFNNYDTDEKGNIINITLTFENHFLENCTTAFPEMSETIFKIRSITNAILFQKEKADCIISTLRNMTDESEAERIASVIRILTLIATGEELRIIGRHQNQDKNGVILNKIMTYIICNARRTITIDDISTHIGMNRSSFCIFFKRATGESFVNYLNEVRIEMACEILKRQHSNISEIGYRCGFNDIPYFNRVFKRLKGISPKEYRKQQIHISMP